MANVKAQKMDNTFLTYATHILADTDKGLSGMKIIEFCNSYALDYNRIIPHDKYPFGKDEVPNKRTALLENLRVFDAPEQFSIIKALCELPIFEGNADAEKLKKHLYERYGNYATERINETQLVQKTKHWLADYPEALKQYDNGLAKYESGIFERNTLDDMRLSFELLIKSITGNDKSLENQKAEIGAILKQSGVSKELREMISTVISYYEKFQNQHVKHNDKVNSNEIEFVIELTSVIMKFLVQADKGDGDVND